ncbi:hypothetical protein [Amorphus sp. 3PC139-8]|uniref:hypothetical protein n=1 Tax=Amorphus sp. 3PC139-8 TaxID=2735676 RepID=UPI00345CFBE4
MNNEIIITIISRHFISFSKILRELPAAMRRGFANPMPKILAKTLIFGAIILAVAGVFASDLAVPIGAFTALGLAAVIVAFTVVAFAAVAWAVWALAVAAVAWAVCALIFAAGVWPGLTAFALVCVAFALALANEAIDDHYARKDQ